MTPRARRFVLESIAAPTASIALALVAGGVLIAIAGKNPLAVYALLFGDTLGSAYGIGQMLAKATPIALTGLSVAVCFRAGLFNVGAEGQMTIGGLCAALTGLAFPDLPAVALVPLGLLAAAAGGAATASLAGVLKSKRGVHEVITTLMTNFIAAAIAGQLMSGLAVAATVRTETLPEAAWLPRLSSMVEAIGLSSLGGALRASPANAAALLAIACACAIAWLLARTRTGFELRVAGASPTAAATAGIDVGGTTRLAFLLGGALAGLAGTSFVLGHKHHYETGFTAGAGFVGIAVALVGRNHPGGVLVAALLFGTLAHGGLVVNSQVSAELVTVLQALVILFLIASLPAFQKLARSRQPVGAS